MSRLLNLTTVAIALLYASLVTAANAFAQAPEAAPKPTPWGISSSASSYRTHADWLPIMAKAGVTTVRLFPEWRGVEPRPGEWNWTQADALVKAAGESKIEINAPLMGSPPGAKAVHAFPMEDLAGWSRFVGASVGRYKQIRYWEVWNEGNGGFNDGKHTTVDYAKLAVTTYDAAKKANPDAQVGLSVASFDAPYLHQTILAQAKAGTPNKFDFLAIHPYEIADGLADPDGEIPFLWMTHTLRGMLKTSAPQRANAEIWITEVGRKLDSHKGREVTEQQAAQDLIKLYTMAVAQGIVRTQWFEARDPEGEEEGFGLLRRNGTPRASFKAFEYLTTVLGPKPKFEGWLALGEGGRGYGFVFRTPDGVCLVAWMPVGDEARLTFPADVGVLDPIESSLDELKAGKTLLLTSAPRIVLSVPADLVEQARANAAKPFPWGGNHALVKVVSGEPGNPDASRGIFQTARNATPRIKFADGSTGILVRGDQGVSFWVHPSFASFPTKEYYVRATVRRIAPGNVGMNCVYQTADGQGRSPYKNVGQWFGVNASDDWQTYTWHITDACFSKMWGYDFALRPEQSVPFVIGKVEVSTEAFK